MIRNVRARAKCAERCRSVTSHDSAPPPAAGTSVAARVPSLARRQSWVDPARRCPSPSRTGWPRTSAAAARPARPRANVDPVGCVLLRAHPRQRHSRERPAAPSNPSEADARDAPRGLARADQERRSAHSLRLCSDSPAGVVRTLEASAGSNTSRVFASSTSASPALIDALHFSLVGDGSGFFAPTSRVGEGSFPLPVASLVGEATPFSAVGELMIPFS